MFGIRGYKKYQKVVKELEEFQETKQEIVYKVIQVLDDKKEMEEEKKRNKAQREMFVNEVIDRIKNYLLDLPIGEYRLDYKQVFNLAKSEYEGIEVSVISNDNRDWTDKLLDRNKKYVKIWRTKTYPDLEIAGWPVNDILKFHNQLENIILLIGKEYGYESKPKIDYECEEVNTSIIP